MKIAIYILIFLSTSFQAYTQNRVLYDVPSDSAAKYPGGDKELYSFIYSHVDSTNDICKGAELVVGFKVDTTGQVSNVFLEREADKKCCEDIIRVFKLLPKFIPGENQKGDKIESHLYLPVSF